MGTHHRCYTKLSDRRRSIARLRSSGWRLAGVVTCVVGLATGALADSASAKPKVLVSKGGSLKCSGRGCSVSIPKPKSRSKVIDLGPAKKYLLSVNGSFSFTSGTAIDSGQLTAPLLVVTQIAPAAGKTMWLGDGNGRVVENLFLRAGCQQSGTVVLSMFVGPAIHHLEPTPSLPTIPESAGPPGEAFPISDDGDLLNPLPRVPDPVIPPGKVGLAVLGAFSSGPPVLKCHLEPERVDVEILMAGQGAQLALAQASNDYLLFASAGEEITRKSKPGENPTYNFVFKLKKA